MPTLAPGLVSCFLGILDGFPFYSLCSGLQNAPLEKIVREISAKLHVLQVTQISPTLASAPHCPLLETHGNSHWEAFEL